MSTFRIPAPPLPVRPETRWRFRFTVLSVVTSVALLAWGAFVTSINAGMAVPDWPSSFNSFDPFNPWPQWWTITPVLAEHGHRLLGALVGLFTLILALWGWRTDPRRWMRRLGFAALALVILQGVLGGLRVVFASLDLAVVHACMAQVFFSTLVAMALFTSQSWLTGSTFPPAPDRPEEARARAALRRLALGTAALLYGQIILGALLRHPGTGIDPLLVGLHITGALLVVTAVAVVGWYAATRLRGHAPVRRTTRVMGVLVVLQFSLGLVAYLVTLDESGMLEPSNVQVIVNSLHMVVGALLMASVAVLCLLAYREEGSEAAHSSERVRPASARPAAVS